MHLAQHTVYDALIILISISKNTQDSAFEQKNHVSPMSWTKEYCTIKAYTSRRGGHTTSVLRLMSDNSMCIGYLARTRRMVDDFEKTCKYRSLGSGFLEFCETFDFGCKIAGVGFEGKKFPHLDAIVVDVSCMLSKSQEEDIYRLATELSRLRNDTNKPFFLIFLQ